MVKKNTKVAPPAGARDSKKTRDSFNNFMANLGIQSNNISSGATYAFNFLTKNRLLLEAMYRESWICGAAVDYVADDMTQGGIEINSTLQPEKVDQIHEAMEDLSIWPSLTSTIKWSRLYGSACALIMVEGQDLKTPLRLETVGPGQFKGLLPLDRWQLLPSIGNLIKDLSPQMGMPKFYDALPDAILPTLGRIHHSRVIRFDGIELPHYQKTIDNLWGESVLERLYDRLVAFDSTSQGIAQLVYRAYLRTLKVDGLREIIAAGGQAYQGLLKNIEMIRQFQSSEGITLLDKNDDFETHSYTFAGLDDALLQFGQQLSGALEMPLVRLFGQSPAGLNSTGESDLRTYYDGIRKKQNTRMRGPLKKILQMVSQSELGEPLPEGFSFTFNPLWQVTELEKSQIAAADTNSAVTAYESGLVQKDTALKELRQSSKTTGFWTNITDEEVQDAEDEPPPALAASDPDDGGAAAESVPGE